jgi:hypothetical protein
MIVGIIVLVFIIIILLEVPTMVRGKYWREFIVFCALLLPAFILSILLGLGISIYSPITAINYLIEMFRNLFS